MNAFPQQGLKTNMVTPNQPNLQDAAQANNNQAGGDAVESKLNSGIHSEYGTEFQ